MSLLAIDAGNSRVKWAQHDGRGWFAHGAADTLEVRDAGRLDIGHGGAIERLVACNVAGPEVARAIEALARQRVACCELLVPVASACGVANGYAEPARLGADRWAALIGAHVSGPAGEDKLVALAGTALTLDALDAEGRHWGGLIVPGADLMRDALARRTADLRPGAQRAASPIALGADWPRDTAAAIAAGLDAALGGALLRLHERMRARAGRAPVVVLAGGDAKRLAAQLPFRCIIDDNLVFNGLRALANRSQPPGP